MRKPKRWLLSCCLCLASLALLAWYVTLLRSLDRACNVGPIVVSQLLFIQLSVLVFSNMATAYSAKERMFWMCQFGYCINLGLFGTTLRGVMLTLPQIMIQPFRSIAINLVLVTFLSLFILAVLADIFRSLEKRAAKKEQDHAQD